MFEKDLKEPITLQNGCAMPRIGIGMWKADDSEAMQAVLWALECGYRMIDTAMIYGNEEAIGKAIKQSGIPREEIFLTTKVWNADQGYETTLTAIDTSLARIGMEYVDLYLIHWPFLDFHHPDAEENKRAETWRAMEEILKQGKALSIGVSNYTIDHLEEMKTYAQTQPAVNQIEFHPFWFRKDLMDYCHAHEIAVEDYCPLSRGKHIDDETVSKIAAAQGKTNAQILIRWGLEHGNIVIPKSVHQSRIKENIDVFDFALSKEEMSALDQLNANDSVVFGTV